MIIATVLKLGKEYKAKHAQWIHKQLKEKGYDAVCLSDTEIPDVETYSLQYNWPGWWSKMELFDPGGPLGNEDIFFLDVDTVLVGDISPFLVHRDFTMLTDFYKERAEVPPPASGIMYIPKEVKFLVWNRFIADPDKNIQNNSDWIHHGDQGFLARLPLKIQRWQNVLPGMVVSYKKDIACRGMIGYNKKRSVGTGAVPYNTRIVCFHGNPRPWEIRCSWVPPLYSYSQALSSDFPGTPLVMQRQFNIRRALVGQRK